MAGKYSPESITPGGYIDEFVIHSPAVELHYNASNQIVKIVKKTGSGGTFERQVTDPDITDYDVDRIVIYSRWKKTR